MHFSKLVSLVLMAFTFNVFAAKSIITVSKFHKSSKANYVYIYAESGRVYKASEDIDLSLLSFSEALEIETEDGHNILTISPASSESLAISKTNASKSLNFSPANFTSMQQIDALHQQLQSDTKKKSQCYQRAHVWSFDMWLAKRVKSGKAFIFYGQTYIEEYDSKWWFHVAPYVLLNHEPVVLDRTFHRTPKTLMDWHRNLVKSHFNCRTIDHYDDYIKNKYTEDCFIRLVPMYFYVPEDIRNYDYKEKAKTHFHNYDIEHSRKAIKRRSRKSL